ncbi:MAG: DUF1992 domain-containing protein [Actinomycetota bacterium]|nr:DUF1992 domain-containing protein [Actinomycetota bacterium]
MDAEDRVEDQIKEALDSGKLAPTRGVGEPIGDLDNDPAWWAKSLLRRERAAERFGDVMARRDSEISRAIGADDLREARAIIVSLNESIKQWNMSVDHERRLDPVSEIWLLTERASARR